MRHPLGVGDTGGSRPRGVAGRDTSSPCFLLLGLGPDGFTYNEEATQPTDGLYSCDPDNVIELSRR